MYMDCQYEYLPSQPQAHVGAAVPYVHNNKHLSSHPNNAGSLETFSSKS